MKQILIVLSIALSLAAPTAALAWRGVVSRVIDGDSIIVRKQGTGPETSVRLFGVDCPENSQPQGKEASAFAARAVLRQEVLVAELSQDRFGRTVALVLKADSGDSLQELLLAAGLAWVDERFCKGCAAWLAVEEDARADEKGIWADKARIPPWGWRKKEKRQGKFARTAPQGAF